MKDLFTGALGRLNNHGGSRIYTTPNTILVSPEYEIEIGEHGNFISCTLDGRLWLFEDRIIALKWNKEAGKMEYATSKSFSDETFVARGRDWILTDSSVIQVTDSSPYIFHETHNEDVTPMEHFYSLLPALDGFQIVKNFLIRKPNESYENLMYPISMPDIYLTFYGNTIWARTQSGVGKVLITENDGAYSLDFEYSYTFSDNSWQNMGIAFINDDIFGFKNNQNNKTLCPCSEDTQLYSVKNSSWSALSGNIFFDPFNHSGIVINNNGINLLASEKSIECKGLSQWLAPAKQIQSIDDNAIISSINNSVLATYLNSGLYRGLLPQKALQLTTEAYTKNDNTNYRLIVEVKNDNINFNQLSVHKDNTLNINFNFELINTFEHNNIDLYTPEMRWIDYDDSGNLDIVDYRDTPLYRWLLPYPVFFSRSSLRYTRLKESVNVYFYDDEGTHTTTIPSGVNLDYEWTRIVWDIEKRNGSIDWDNYSLENYRKIMYYFYINLDTGDFIDKTVTFEENDEWPYYYVVFQEKDNILSYGYTTKDYYTQRFDYIILENFDNGWRQIESNYLVQIGKQEMTTATINFNSEKFYVTSTVHVNKVNKHYTSNPIFFNNQQKELLKNYKLFRIGDFYNIYDEKKFAHILYFRDENNAVYELYNADKEGVYLRYYPGFFFVFHTTIL